MLLFQGPPNIGKRTFALAVARQLVGSNREQHPDIHSFSPDPKSHNYPIAIIRELLQQASLPPLESRNQTFLIDGAELLTSIASNALLKLLEEPTAANYFILITSAPLLPTLASRCTPLSFSPLSPEEAASLLDQRKAAPSPPKQPQSNSSEQQLLAPLLRALLDGSSHLEFLSHFEKLEEPSPELRTALFEEIITTLRKENPSLLETMIPLLTQAEEALRYHLKFKTVMEQLYLQLNKKRSPPTI